MALAARARTRADASMGELRITFPHCLLAAGEVHWPAIVSLVGVGMLWMYSLCGLIESRATWAWRWCMGAAIVFSLTWAALMYQQLCRFRKAPLQRRRRGFRTKVSNQNPRPRPCQRGPGRAVSMGDVWDLFEFFQDGSRAVSALSSYVCVCCDVHAAGLLAIAAQ